MSRGLGWCAEEESGLNELLYDRNGWVGGWVGGWDVPVGLAEEGKTAEEGLYPPRESKVLLWVDVGRGALEDEEGGDLLYYRWNDLYGRGACTYHSNSFAFEVDGVIPSSRVH